ncbi:hypothetical protein B1R94_04140 [Mycolicibacterium litorale]|nr:hypothetical protein B1R94_04140 [Mycolicibacterium litorale]
MIALHAERVTGEPSAVRWVVRTDGLPVGRVRTAAGDLGRMFDDGALTGGLIDDTSVVLWLREGLSWRAEGPTVQAALRAALRSPAEWVVEAAPGEVLERVTADVLEGAVGDFVRSHGGSVRVQRIGDAVAVQLGGACEHCPAAEQTLRQRLVNELRRHCPDLVERESRGGQLLLELGVKP